MTSSLDDIGSSWDKLCFLDIGANQCARVPQIWIKNSMVRVSFPAPRLSSTPSPTAGLASPSCLICIHPTLIFFVDLAFLRETSAWKERRTPAINGSLGAFYAALRRLLSALVIISCRYATSGGVRQGRTSFDEYMSKTFSYPAVNFTVGVNTDRSPNRLSQLFRP